MNKITTSEYALKVQTALAETGMTTRVCGWGDPPIVPYEQDGWLLERILKTDLEFTMPRGVLERIRKLERVCTIKHILIAHEIDERKPPQIPPEVIQAVKKTIPILGAILWGLVTILATVALLAFRLTVFVLSVDPVVIAVIEEPSGELVWLEVAKWYE
jgi:hypothetical protein